MSAIAGLFNFVPGWLWAIALAISLAGGFGEATLKKHYQADAIVQKAEVTRLDSAIKTQKDEAAATLRTLTASVLAQQKTIDAAHADQEQKDVQAKTTIAQQSAALDKLLDRLGRLRDPFPRRGASGGGAASQSPASPDAGAGDASAAGGLLSPELSGFLVERFKTAEALSAAYRSCRADIYRLRGAGEPVSTAPVNYSLPLGKKLPQ